MLLCVCISIVIMNTPLPATAPSGLAATSQPLAAPDNQASPETTVPSVNFQGVNPPRDPAVLALNAALPKVEIKCCSWGELSEDDQQKYTQQVVNLFADNFPAGTYKDGVIAKLLRMGTKGSEAMSPAFVAIDEANQTIAGAMLPSRQLCSREKLSNSLDPREAQVYRLIDAGKFPFVKPDTKDEFDRSKIYVPAGICRNRDDKYKGKGIPETIYRAAIESLKQGVYKDKARYLVTSHDLDNPASTKMHNAVGFSQEYLSDECYKYSQNNDGKIDKAMRFINLCS